MFDIIQFQSVTEEELENLRRLAFAGKYQYQITECTLSLNHFKELNDSNDADLQAFKEKQHLAREDIYEKETQLLEEVDSDRHKNNFDQSSDGSQQLIPQSDDNQKTFYAIVGGVIQSIAVQIEDQVVSDRTILCTIQAMKTDITIKADCDGILNHIFIKLNQLINAGDPLFVIKFQR
ncbi:unnamed protein product [Didymodactylos carnosus]|nr:unnamed protein product [Didymodactylos carnosus]CAF3737660.1 unnamed protein product [Didymodactylos carnosus]